MDNGRTQVNGPENKKVDDDAKSLASKGQDRQTITIVLIHQDNREEEDSPALKIVLRHQYEN